MGRYLSEDNPQSVNSDDTGRVATLIAGAAVTAGDLLQTKTDGKVYPLNDSRLVNVTEFGATLFPETVYSSINNATIGWRPAVLRHSNGYIYTVGNTGFSIKRYDITGKLISTIAIDSTTSSVQHRLVELSNGNIAVACCSGSPIYVNYAVVDQDTNIVKAFTQGSYIQSGDVQFGLCALAGGGFSISWSNFNTGVASFRVFNNAGAPTISDTQWGNLSGSSGQGVSSAVCQLSNGNLVLLRSAVNANTKYAIYTPSGVQVKAETLLTTDSFTAQPYIIQPGTGYFCLRVGAQSTNKFYVFNDAGDMQGTPYEPVVNNNAINPAAVLWDGADFFAVFATTAENQMLPIRLVKIPTSGGDGATIFSPYKLATGAQIMSIDAYWDGNNIAIITSQYNVNQRPSYCLISKSGTTIIDPFEFGSLPGTAQGNCVRGFNPGADGVFGAAWIESAPNTAAKLIVVKNVNTAILGVATSPASTGEIAQVATGKGVYKINTMKKIDKPLQFDHTSGKTVPGNSGSIFVNSVILRGI